MDIFEIISSVLLILWTLIDKFGWFVFVLVVIVIVYKNTYWFRDIEKIAENYEKKLTEIIEKDKKTDTSILKELVGKEEDLYKRFIKTHENYLHLKERFRHEKNAKWIKEDWVNYLKSIKYILNWYGDEYHGEMPDNMKENKANEVYRAEIKLDEIEKRFKKLENEK